MDKTTKALYFLFIFSLSIHVGCTNANENILDTLQSVFVKNIINGSNDFDLKVITDKADDKRLFLKKSLPNIYTQKNETIAYKEIFIRHKKEQGFYHLGLISLTYSTSGKAKNNFTEMKNKIKSKYFANTKILTKFNLLLSDNKIIILYSETFMDKKVNHFITSAHANI